MESAVADQSLSFGSVERRPLVRLRRCRPAHLPTPASGTARGRRMCGAFNRVGPYTLGLSADSAERCTWLVSSRAGGGRQPHRSRAHQRSLASHALRLTRIASRQQQTRLTQQFGHSTRIARPSPAGRPPDESPLAALAAESVPPLTPPAVPRMVQMWRIRLSQEPCYDQTR